MTETDPLFEEVKEEVHEYLLNKSLKPVKKTQRKYKNGKDLFKASQYLRSVMKNKKNLHIMSTEYCRKCSLKPLYSNADAQVKLHCRQLSTIRKELRKSILQQDWDNTRILLAIYCQSGDIAKPFEPFLARVCFLLLFSHCKSSKKLVCDFIKTATGYILDEDVDKFLRILFALRKEALSKWQPGEAIKGRSFYKLIQDPAFEAL